MKRLSMLVGLALASLGAVACGSAEPNAEPNAEPEEEAAETEVALARGEGTLSLGDAKFYRILDAETGAVRETVVVVHNSSNPCLGGCSSATLGAPEEGDELGLLKLVFRGAVTEGVHAQGSDFVQARLQVGSPGCGVPDRLGPDGEVVEEGQPPGLKSYESKAGEVTIAEVSLRPDGEVEKISGSVDVTFEVGTTGGQWVAGHCAVLDSAVVE